MEKTISRDVSLAVAGSRIADQPAALASAVGCATRAAAAFSLPEMVLSRPSSASISASPTRPPRASAVMSSQRKSWSTARPSTVKEPSSRPWRSSYAASLRAAAA